VRRVLRKGSYMNAAIVETWGKQAQYAKLRYDVGIARLKGSQRQES